MIKSLFKWKGEKRAKKGKPDLYLHIGMGKTGTTALQEFFWANRQVLDEHGICYPEYCVVSAAHHRLSPHVPEFLKDTWKFESVKDWAPKISRLDSKKILISSELIAWAQPGVVEDFCKELKRWFNVYVVLYLRRQDNLIMAGYNQQIKAGTQKKDIYSVLEQSIDRFDYDKKMKPWVNSLGGGNIIVRPYERQQFFRGDIRFDFIHYVFGIDVFDKFELVNTNSNPRLCYAAMEYKRWINGIIQDSNLSSLFNDVLLRYSAETDGSSTSIYASSSILSPSDRLEILKRFENTNERIAREYLGREDGVLFYDRVPDGQESWAMPELPDQVFQEITDYIKENDEKVFELLPEYREPSRPKKIIVHFGTHKTGSSSIQNYFYKYDSEKYDYLKYNQPNSSQLIGNAFLKYENLRKKRVCDYESYSRVRALARTRLEKIITNTEKETSIISAEVISIFDYEELLDLVEFFKKRYKEVRFIGYVREPVSFSVSVYQEALKRRCVKFEYFKVKYDKFINNLDSMLGRDSVDVYLFDRPNFPNGSVVNHFLNLLEIDHIPSECSQDNVSLSLSAVKFLYAYRCILKETEIDAGHPASLQMFLELLSTVGDKKFDVSREVATQIKEVNKGVISWLQVRVPFQDAVISNGSEYGISSEKDLLSFSESEIDKLFLLAGQYGVPVMGLEKNSYGVAECVASLRRKIMEKVVSSGSTT